MEGGREKSVKYTKFGIYMVAVLLVMTLGICTVAVGENTSVSGKPKTVLTKKKWGYECGKCSFEARFERPQPGGTLRCPMCKSRMFLKGQE